jgi:glycerol kinase
MSEADELVLALDQGGQASRAVLFDATGREVAEARVPIATRHAGHDRVEHDPEELVSSLAIAVQDACGSGPARGRDIVAAGLASQRSTIVCWDRRDGRALSAALSWQDRRQPEFLTRLKPRERWIRERTGLVLSPHYGANKLRWCLEELPAVQAAAREGNLAAGPLSSFLLHRLLEERPVCVDPSNAARTLLFDPVTLDWVPELLAAFAIPANCLPAPVPTRHDFGHLRVAGHDVPLLVCTGDQAAAAFAFGDLRDDRACLNVGTGAFLQRAIAADAQAVDGLLKSVLYSDATGAVCSLEGTVNGAASALAWLQTRVALDLERAVNALPAQAPRQTPLFINGVGGLGAPWWKPEFPVEFVGQGEELAQLIAVIESIAFLVCVNLEAMRSAGPLAAIAITGGLARSDYLCQSLADLGGLTVERAALREATARGTAYLAAGRPASWLAVPLERSFEPAVNHTLEARYRRWREEMSRRGA